MATLALMAISFWAAPGLRAAKDKPDEFRKGVLAATANDWGESARFMRMAHAKEPENGEFVKVGTRRMAYLPLYHLGLALYKDDRCPEALEAWRQSTDLGYVTQVPEFASRIVQYQREGCSSNSQ